MSAATLDELAAALTRHLADEGDISGGEMLGDWTIVAHIQPLDPDAEDAYAAVNSSPTMTWHAQRGLLESALDEMRRVT